ncbi:hypothetical protein AB0M20_31880, partial [Actinoplanes sp. NPDC051633]|uniref:hypothetical protein n=1 Tax=Actinoplanes sp. NPDC051633 TaxID=3155670 RepID=UPI003449DA11
VSRVTENSQSMTTAATAMREVTTLMSGNMKADLEQLAKNVVDSSRWLAAVEGGLSKTSGSIASTTVALQEAADRLRAIARAPRPPAPRTGLVNRIFGGR